jgi:hypothetical protein
MVRDRLKIWYDPEGDYLDVIYGEKAGYFREAANERVMAKVDDDANVLGFSVLRICALGRTPLEIAL